MYIILLPKVVCTCWCECFSVGVDVSRTVMSHLDRTISDDQRLLEFAKRGCYLEYDLFGIECSHFQVGGADGRGLHTSTIECMPNINGL